MSAKVQGWAWDQDALVQRKAILLWLANRATDSGVCFPGRDPWATGGKGGATAS
jgi:hypothetical protein